MIRRRPLRLLVSVLLLPAAALVGCGGRKPPSLEPAPGREVGLYRARFDDGQERERRFRLLLFAAAPDRLHGEVLSPVGPPVMIVDGGDGQLAVTLPRDRVSYVGAATVDAVESVLGVRASLSGLVAGLLGEATGEEGYRVVREGAARGRLPQRFEIADGRRRLTLEVKRFQPLPDSGRPLGSGLPPDGTELRALEELAPAEVRQEWEEGE